MKQLLLVEDDRSLGATLQERLQKESYGVTWVQNQVEAKQKLDQVNFDLVILDIGLPDGSGLELARNLANPRPPFLFMTAMNTAENRLLGYEIGAEEFIPKPFHLKELLLRVSHVLQTHSQSRLVRAGEFWVDLDAMCIRAESGEKRFIATRDFQLLEYLIRRAPRVLSRDEILNAIWGEDKFPSTRTVDNAVVRLRQELGSSGAELIHSVRGIGYQWLGTAVGSSNRGGEE